MVARVMVARFQSLADGFVEFDPEQLVVVLISAHEVKFRLMASIMG